MDLFSPAQACMPSSFSALQLLGAKILSVDANIVTNYNRSISDRLRFSRPSVDVWNATFCNVTVSYTHPGKNDAINAEIWMPVENWNGRLQSVGGGSWVAGRYLNSYAGMAGAIHDGYATATTDAGVSTLYSTLDSLPEWVLANPGNLDLVALDNFGQTSLGDLAILAKQVVTNYYGRGPLYSYWNGCSNGGRQASILAQQYPEEYDGIIAAAPAMYWAELGMSMAWPAFYMDLTKQYPSKCEMNQLTSIALVECDALDGVKDGLISDPGKCKTKFRPQGHIGTAFTCEESGVESSISAAAADVAKAIFEGPRYSNGDFMWYGYEIGTDLWKLAASNCTENGICIPRWRKNIQFWWRSFVLQDLSANDTTLTLTHEQYDQLYLTLKKIAAPMAATEARISKFQKTGGKMITYHGLVDPVITPGSTLHYYQEVSNVIDNATDFYRYYQVPGLEHCQGGNGGQPIQLFNQLRSWVENGTVPVASPVTVKSIGNATMDQVLCPYPQKARYRQSCAQQQTSSLECWRCE